MTIEDQNGVDRVDRKAQWPHFLNNETRFCFVAQRVTNMRWGRRCWDCPYADDGARSVSTVFFFLSLFCSVHALPTTNARAAPGAPNAPAIRPRWPLATAGASNATGRPPASGAAAAAVTGGWRAPSTPTRVGEWGGGRDGGPAPPRSKGNRDAQWRVAAVRGAGAAAAAGAGGLVRGPLRGGGPTGEGQRGAARSTRRAATGGGRGATAAALLAAVRCTVASRGRHGDVDAVGPPRGGVP